MTEAMRTPVADFVPAHRTVVVGASGSGLSGLATQIYRRTQGATMVSQDAISHITFLRGTVVEEIAFGLEQRGVEVEEMQQRVDAIIAMLGLEAVAERNPAALSGGQTKRVAIACVAVLGAELLILDDPFAGLDAASRGRVRELLASYEGAVLVLAHEAPDGFGGEWKTYTLDSGFLTPGLPREEEHVLPEPVAAKARRIDLGEVRGSRPTAPRRWWQLRPRKDTGFATDAVTLRPRAGGVLWLQGANGAGKTTLLRTLVGFGGDYRCPVSVSLATQRASDQVVGSTLVEFLPDAAARRSLGVEEGIHPLDLPQALLRLAQVAAVMCQRRELVLLDEPDVGLDSAHRAQFHRLLAEALARGQAIIMTCHDPGVMREVSAYAQVETETLG